MFYLFDKLFCPESALKMIRHPLDFPESLPNMFQKPLRKSSITNIPQEISVLDFDDGIVFALVSSEQISQLAQLDFVVQISKPIEASVSPIPTLKDVEHPIDGEIAIPIIVGIIITIGTIAVLYNKKRMDKIMK